MKKLEILSLRGNEITDTGSTDNMVELKTLFLSYNKINKVKSFHWCANVEEIELDQNQIEIIPRETFRECK